MTRHEVLCAALELLPGIAARDLHQIFVAARESLPDATIEEIVIAAASVERAQNHPS